jgi:hypothetical protein
MCNAPTSQRHRFAFTHPFFFPSTNLKLARHSEDAHVRACSAQLGLLACCREAAIGRYWCLALCSLLALRSDRMQDVNGMRTLLVLSPSVSYTKAPVGELVRIEGMLDDSGATLSLGGNADDVLLCRPQQIHRRSLKLSYQLHFLPGYWLQTSTDT